MTHTDGDGWIECSCGNRHWGLHGAAGLLLVRAGRILLQHRAPWVHTGDTWGIPGGASDSHESALEGASREAREEIGIDTSLITPVTTFSDNHGDWCYDTIIAIADPALVARELNDESLEVRWVDIDQVEAMHLHPAFARDWPELRVLILRELQI